MKERKPVTTRTLREKKSRGERIVAVTAYDFPSALLADSAGVDLILVGDSLGMVVLGHETTVPVTLDDMLHHTRAVARAKPAALLVADMPFLAAAISPEEALRAAGRLLQEGGAAAVKIEGHGPRVAETIARLTEAGVPVMGHLGLVPQSVHQLGGWRVQGRTGAEAAALLEGARSLESAGAFALVLEGVPAEVGAGITSRLGIPTIGIGAGAGCDGQVQVWHDLLGLSNGWAPRHARKYAELGPAIVAALERYAHEVREGAFPGPEHAASAPELAEVERWTSSGT